MIGDDRKKQIVLFLAMAAPMFGDRNKKSETIFNGFPLIVKALSPKFCDEWEVGFSERSPSKCIQRPTNNENSAHLFFLF